MVMGATGMQLARKLSSRALARTVAVAAVLHGGAASAGPGDAAGWDGAGVEVDAWQAAEAATAAGHRAHAVEQLRVFLARRTGVTAGRRATAEARLAAMLRETRPVLLRVEGTDGPVRVVLRFVGDGRPAIDLEPGRDLGDGRRVDLDPGLWSLTAGAPGRRDAQRVVTIEPRARRGAAPEPEVLTFVLAPDRVPVTLELGPPAALTAGATWTLTPEGHAGEPRTIAATEARSDLSLEPGRWRARVEAPGFVAQEVTWTAGEAPPPAVMLAAEAAPEPAPAPAPAPATRPVDARLGLGLGLGVAGAASLGLGAGLLIQNRGAYGHFQAAPDNAGFVAALTATEAGAGFVGAGFGLAAAGLGAGLGLKDRGLWAELTAGGGVALIGAAWYAREWQRVQRDLYDGNDEAATPDAHDGGALRREAAAAAVLGAGVGLVSGAGVALLTRYLLRTLRGRRTTARWGMVVALGGLGVRGRF